MPAKKKLESKAKPKIKMEFLDTPPRSLRETSIQYNFNRRLEEVVNQREVRNLLKAGTRLYEQDLLELDEYIVPDSHTHLWQSFTNNLINFIGSLREPIVWLLLGNKKYRPIIRWLRRLTPLRSAPIEEVKKSPLFLVRTSSPG